ncbi:NTP transferase domain-containing protein [Nanchangia anserum]|uniref:NTP transferase domain-containing protein n=1 Tax=Nanchangia anserum TaxID=2692125 RepID=A0A8I0GDV3_9ACTO|nr:NTP transferase domain-containing protein [Nanchangia anserum]MBD3689052.1 NTP transferase domain-containing protein [Nanchangia anserum]QOX81294.1 NTP transferase domain-containing protein [Nanchangia anserum]
MHEHAIILAGGSGERLGGVDKAAIRYRDHRLLDRLLAALSGIDTVVVAPPHVDVPAGVRWTLEEPPGGGPAAGIVWGLAAAGLLDDPVGCVGVFSVDSPIAPDIAADLFAVARSHPHVGAVACSPSGQRHHLLAVYPAPALVAAVRALAAQHPPATPWYAGVRDLAARRLTSGIAVEEVGYSDADMRDIDTPADAAAWGAHVPESY